MSYQQALEVYAQAEEIWKEIYNFKTAKNVKIIKKLFALCHNNNQELTEKVLYMICFLSYADNKVISFFRLSGI
jgi:hypothetical protein